METSKKQCCGVEVKETKVIKLSDNECAIAGYFCQRCGRVYDENKAPISRNGKKLFVFSGALELK